MMLSKAATVIVFLLSGLWAVGALLEGPKGDMVTPGIIMAVGCAFLPVLDKLLGTRPPPQLKRPDGALRGLGMALGAFMVIVGLGGTSGIKPPALATSSPVALVAQVAQATQPPPTVAPMPAQPLPVVAQPVTNDSAVGVAAVQVLGEVVEREQRQNEALANRPSGISDTVVIAGLMGLFFIAVLILVGRLRRPNVGQPAPDIRIQAPTAPVVLKPGDYFEVNGQIFRVPEQIGPNQQRQIKGKR